MQLYNHCECQEAVSVWSRILWRRGPASPENRKCEADAARMSVCKWDVGIWIQTDHPDCQERSRDDPGWSLTVRFKDLINITNILFTVSVWKQQKPSNGVTDPLSSESERFVPNHAHLALQSIAPTSKKTKIRELSVQKTSVCRLHMDEGGLIILRGRSFTDQEEAALPVPCCGIYTNMTHRQTLLTLWGRLTLVKGC